MKDKMREVLAIANNAIWFDDSSDYLRVLYEICSLITGDPMFIADDYMEPEGCVE